MIGPCCGNGRKPGRNDYIQRRSFKAYRAWDHCFYGKGSRDRYFQEDSRKLVPEGVEGKVPYKGHVRDTIYQLIGGLRASMGYCGTPTIRDLQENGKFVRITGAGLRESHPHDIIITKEAPNYSIES